MAGDPGQIEENTARVQERMEAACLRAGRRSEEVKLVAITKTVDTSRIRRAYAAGVRDFGENRVQEADEKRPAVSDLTATWHLVGHLQTNKARPARALFHWVHSIDSLRLAEKLHQAAACSGERLQILLQVKLGDEPAKSGIPEYEVQSLAEQVSRLETLDLRGLMTIPPLFEDPEQARPFYRRLRERARAIERARLPNVRMEELSMGMSHDFEVAIEEGATLVRVGTAIFGERRQQKMNPE